MSQQKKDLLLIYSAITMGIPLQKPPVFPLLLLLQNTQQQVGVVILHTHALTLAHRQTNRHTHTQHTYKSVNTL